MSNKLRSLVYLGLEEEMLNKLSFRTKLLLLCGLIATVGAFIGIVNYIGLKQVSSQYEFITTKSEPKIHMIDKMFLDFRRVRITVRTLGLPGLPKADAEQSIKDAQTAIADYNKTREEYIALGFIPGQKEIFDKLDAEWVEFQKIGTLVVGYYKTGKAEDYDKMIKIFFHECPDRARAFTKLVNEIISFHEAVIAKKVAEASHDSALLNTISISVLVVGLSLGLIIGFIFSNNIAKTLNGVSSSLSSGAHAVSEAAEQIAAASHELSESATEQASSLQETTSSIEETSAMVNKNAENAMKSAGISLKGQESAIKGKKAVQEMVLSIDEISKNNSEIMLQVEEGNREISEIVKVIAEIGNKTKIINDIVFQTKLLSFNASVEAARAGEQGKGFAVVAEEVGNLARMSGTAAKEISDMLEESIHKVEEIVDRTKTRVEKFVLIGKEKVQSGTVVANHCNDILDEIVTNVESVNSLVTEISVASQEQAGGIREITKALTQLDQVGHQNTAASQQASASAQELNNQVVELRLMVEKLNVVMSGAKESNIRAERHDKLQAFYEQKA